MPLSTTTFYNPGRGSPNGASQATPREPEVAGAGVHGEGPRDLFALTFPAVGGAPGSQHLGMYNQDSEQWRVIRPADLDFAGFRKFQKKSEKIKNN